MEKRREGSEWEKETGVPLASAPRSASARDVGNFRLRSSSVDPSQRLYGPSPSAFKNRLSDLILKLRDLHDSIPV